MSLSITSPPLAVETCRDFSELARHTKAWGDLAWHAPQRNPTLSPAWTTAFLRHQLKGEEEWLCSFAYAGDELVGVLPLVVAPHPILGSSRPRLRTPIGSYSPSGDVLLRADVAQAALEELLREVGRQIPGHLGIRLSNARQNAPVWSALKNGINGYSIIREREHPCSVIDVTGDFEAYLQPHTNLKQNLRRFHKKLSRHGKVTFEIKGNGFEMGAFQTFLALEGAGWKGRKGTAIINDARVTAFYEALAKGFASEGRWEWHLLRVDDRVVAAGMGARCGACLMLPKYAFDEELSDCRPGNLLTAEVIKAAFADPELAEINHMSHPDWHKRWHMSEEMYAGLDLVRSNATATFFHLPRVLLSAIIRDFVRPNIPVAVKEARRRYKRRGDHKPRRAAEAAATQNSSDEE